MYDKTSVLPRTIGRILPARLRIWIRSRVFPSLHRLNTAEVNSTGIPDEVVELLTEYYRNDLRELEQKYGISF
jgi:hypothetical protein